VPSRSDGMHSGNQHGWAANGSSFCAVLGYTNLGKAPNENTPLATDAAPSMTAWPSFTDSIIITVVYTCEEPSICHQCAALACHQCAALTCHECAALTCHQMRESHLNSTAEPSCVTGLHL
jgi:hypothetical protein